MRESEPAPAPSSPPQTEAPTVVAELRMRADRLKVSDPVAAARALVELGIHEERVSFDRTSARRAYEYARALVRTYEPALVRVRRVLEGRGEQPLALNIVDDEIGAAQDDALRADLLAERARLCQSMGRTGDALGSYGDALRIDPLHAASLRGLEAALWSELEKQPGRPTATALSVHLERLAEAYSPGEHAKDGDGRLAAWLHVERALVLDDALGAADQARAALERAVSFEPAPGPVRDAMTQHLVRHRDDVGLARSLAIEAEHERDPDRASRLLYTAARLTIDKLGTPTDAIVLLQRASARAPATTPTARRTLAELIRQLEVAGQLAPAAAVREQQLALVIEPEAIMHEHVRLSEIYDSLGLADQAAAHAGRALEREPEDTATRERLDRALQRLGRHDQRVETWLVEAHAERPVAAKVAAFRRAADIAERHLKRPDEAIAHLRTAWALDPGNAEVFAALSALLAPGARDPEADARGVRGRLDLYIQAAQAAEEPARRIGLYEKVLSIWEDELCQPARALEVIDQILAIDPRRRTTILALQRNAERAGDAKRLADALSAEADLTTDPSLKRRLLLRAGEVVGDRAGDRDRGLALIDRALAIDGADPVALRARFRLHDKAGRYQEAKKALLALIAREPLAPGAFSLWLEVAIVDEQRLKRPADAVDAYRQAARVKPHHPMPALEISRLLRQTGDHAKLVESLVALAGETPDPSEFARLLFQAAEVQELSLGDDAAALASLTRADALIVNVVEDPAILEAMERIHVRRRTSPDLVAHYGKWLERHPPAAVDHTLRIALARVLAGVEKGQAITLLEGLLGVVPAHVPALRMIEQLQRSQGAYAALAATLRAEAGVFSSAAARCGALWELAAHEEHLGAGVTLEALQQIVVDAPHDQAALDGTIRIASKLIDGVTIPHPAALATRARLVLAIQAKRELARDPVARAMYQIEEAILAEAYAPDEATALRSALFGYRNALNGFPESLLAAHGLDRLGQRLGDRDAVILAQRALAGLSFDPRKRAGHLVRAAELIASESGKQAYYDALELYEEALRHDADSVAAGASIARMLPTDPARLVDRLGAALERATSREAIVLLGTEVARAVLAQREAQGAAAEAIDAGIGIAAMRRVLAQAPDGVPSLMLLARLLSAQRLWSEARDVLGRVVEVASDGPSRVAAHFELCNLYAGGLQNLDASQSALDAVLAIEPHNHKALERLHKLATTRGDKPLAVSALGRLAESESDPARRAEYDLRLADACREAGDSPGLVRALCDAIVCAPADLRAWTGLSSLYRIDKPDGAAGYAKTLQQVIDLATSRRAALEPRWLTTLGLIEATVLHRGNEGVAHLRQAVALPGALPDARVALGQGLMAAARNQECIQVLRDLFTPDGELLARVGDISTGLATLEAALATEGRAEERLAVEEARACLGEVKAERTAQLRARRLPPDVPYAQALAGAEMSRLLLPEARLSAIDVGVAIAPVAAKALRFELSALGVNSRERIGARDGHPTRLLAEKLARALGIENFELYLSPTWQGAARVYPGDPPAIVGPTSFIDLPENEQSYALARLLTRVALGMTWLDELSVEAIDGLLLASVRSVDPQFAAGELTPAREHAAQSFLGPMQKAIGRRQRKLLEELAPTVSAAYDARAFTIGVRRSEYRIAYVLGGDLLAAIDYLRRFDREIARATETPRVLLQHPVTNELIRYAMTPEAYAERRRVGTVWTAS